MTPPRYGSTAIIFLESAGKHGFTEDDAVHALGHARFVRRGFDRTRVVGRADPTPWMGPARDLVVFHCMELRDKFRALMKGERS